MRTTILLAAAAGVAVAHPGMNMMMQELAERQAPAAPVELIGDLINGATTDTGKAVVACLTGSGVSCEVPGDKVNPSELVVVHQSLIASRPMLPQPTEVRHARPIPAAYGTSSERTSSSSSPTATVLAMISLALQCVSVSTMLVLGPRLAVTVVLTVA
jgi:hypothetical protein